MVADARSEHLSRLLGGWLHEDFDLEFDTAEAAVSAALRDAPAEVLALALEDLVVRRPRPESEGAARAFSNAFCSYHPPGDGLTYNAWLDHLEELVRDRLADSA
jgi:hypothetical protein